VEFLKNKIKAMRTFATETALSSAVGAYDGEVVSVSVTGNVYVWKSATGTWEIQVKRNTDGSYVLPSGSVSAAGAWTFGVVDGTAAHIFNGNLLQIRRSDNSKLRFTPSGSTSYFDSYGVNNITNGAYGFRSARSDDSNFITLGTVGATGIWSLGQVSSPNYNNVCHVINGGLKGGGSTGSSSSARFYIGTNFNAFDHTATSRTKATFSGGGISFDNSGAGDGVIAFYANQAGDALATDADIVGAVTDAGAWTLGASASTALNFTVNGTARILQGDADSEILGLYGTTTSSACRIRGGGDGTAAYALQIDMFGNTAQASRHVLIQDADTTVCKFQGDGRWYAASLGNSAGTYPMKWSSGTGELTYDSSTRIVKENIRNVNYGLAEVLAMTPRAYNYKNGGREDIGFIAEEACLVMPELCPMAPRGNYTGDKEDTVLIPSFFHYDRYVAVLTKAIQELNAKVESLQSEIALLKGA